MKENRRSDYLPNIFYSAERKWCGFSFNIMTQFVDFDIGYTLPADMKEFNVEEITKLKLIREKNKQDFKDKFPVDEFVKKHEQEKFIKKFTGLTDDTIVNANEDHMGIVIYSNYSVYAPQMSIAIETSCLMVNLHNGGNALIGLTMSAYGLRALKTLYDAYGVSSNDLPSLDFQKDYLKAIVPIVHLDDKRNYDIIVRNIKPEILENYLEFTVPYSIGDAKVRSETAFALLEKTSQQALRNLYRLEEQAVPKTK
jgi:hypothetical protein